MRKRVAFLTGILTLALTCPIFAQNCFVEVSSGAADQEDNMFSRVCKIKEDGTLDWGNKIKIGKGKSPCVFLDGKIAVLVHRGSTKESAEDLFYHVGAVDLTTMAVTWGPEVKYGNGAQPFVSFKGNRVVEVHQSGDHDRLWITMGTIDVQRQQISFGEAVKYDPEGRNPSVSLGTGN